MEFTCRQTDFLDQLSRQQKWRQFIFRKHCKSWGQGIRDCSLADAGLACCCVILCTHFVCEAIDESILNKPSSICWFISGIECRTYICNWGNYKPLILTDRNSSFYNSKIRPQIFYCGKLRPTLALIYFSILTCYITKNSRWFGDLCNLCLTFMIHLWVICYCNYYGPICDVI